MGRRLEHRVAATHGALVEGEQVVAYGFCWAAQLRRVPLLFLRRSRYLMVLTNRRLLLFPRRGRHRPGPSDLVLGKRYEWFKLGRIRRARLLLQVHVTTGNGARMIFELPPHRRELVRALTAQLGDGSGPGEPRGQPAAADSTPRARDDDHVFWGPSTQSS